MYEQLQSPPADDDAVAAALAAIRLYLAAEQAPVVRARRPAWRAAGIVAAQGIDPAHQAPPAAWGSAERIGRASRWSAGMLGTFD